MYTPEEALLIKKALAFANNNDSLFQKHASLKGALVEAVTKQAGFGDKFKSTDIPKASNISLKSAPRPGSFMQKFRDVLNIGRLKKADKYKKALAGLERAIKR